MSCEKCGADIKKGERFCPECGAKQNMISSGAKKAKEKIKAVSNKVKIAVGAGMALILVIVILAMNNNPDKIASKFCNIVVKGDVIDIFDIMYFPKSDYITKSKIENVKKKMFDEDSYLTTVEECEYKKISSYKDKTKYKITIKQDGEEETEEIQVIRSNKFLIFNDYKLYMEDLFYGDESITVYKNSEVFVDGKKLENPKSNENNQETYTIKNVLAKADYEIKITHPLFEDYKGNNFDYYISSNDVSDQLKASVKKETEAMLTNFVKEIYPNAYENKSTSGAEAYVDKDKVNISDIVKDINAYKYYTYKDTSVGTIDFDSISYMDNNKLKIDMSVKVNYSYETGYTSYVYSSYSTEYPTITIEKNNDSWKIIDFEE